MSSERRGHGLLASLWGAAGVFIVGFFGAEALFAPASEGISLGATLIPSALAACGAFAYLLTEPAEKPAASRKGVNPPTPFPRAVEGPDAPASGSEARAA